jgi:hypothetical protein
MIYVLRVQNQRKGFLKIGTTETPARRMRDIQTNCPFDLSLVSLRPGTIKEEREIHRKLREYKTRGEWFEDTKEVREFLNISMVHQEMKKDFVTKTGWYKVAVFIEANKNYSYSAEMLCSCLEVDIEKLSVFYHNKRFDSPFRLETIGQEDAAKINLVGPIGSGLVVSHPELFNPVLGGYEKFWEGPTRVTPFNHRLYPEAKLGDRVWH